jgi:hypothetical protein
MLKNKAKHLTLPTKNPIQYLREPTQQRWDVLDHHSQKQSQVIADNLPLQNPHLHHLANPYLQVEKRAAESSRIFIFCSY